MANNSVIDKAKNIIASNPENTLNKFNNEAMLKKVETLYNFSKKWIKDRNITEFGVNDVIQITPILMGIIQDIEKKEKNKDKNRGEYKKQIVMLVIKLLLQDYKVPILVPNEMSDEFVNNFIIDHLLPGTINTIIDVAKGDIDIRKIGTRVAGCLGYCCSAKKKK